MLIQRQHIIAKRFLQIRISVRICSGIKNTERISSFCDTIVKIVIQISSPIVTECRIQISICLSVLFQIDQFCECTCLFLSVIHIVIVESLAIRAKCCRQITVGLGIEICVKQIPHGRCLRRYRSADQHCQYQGCGHCLCELLTKEAQRSVLHCHSSSSSIFLMQFYTSTFILKFQHFI